MKRDLTGSYVLVMSLSGRAVIEVGNLGPLEFGPGYYSYTGSAMAGMAPRLARHLLGRKTIHWHIDYLMDHVKVISILLMPSHSKDECEIMSRIHRKADRAFPIARFGSSDCRCPSHLYHYLEDPRPILRELFVRSALD